MNTTNLTIKEWAVEDRPREKLQKSGVRHLSDAELLAILIGSGSRNQTAVELSRNILRAADNSLHVLGRWNVDELRSKFKGVGEAKAVTIVAALELARRLPVSELPADKPITGSFDIFTLMAPVVTALNYEEFWVVYLNRSNVVVSKKVVSQGGVAATVIDPKVIFKHALDLWASSVILCHNHPSGNLTPSESDDLITKKLFDAGKCLDISVLDHIIVAGNNYYSYRDKSRIFG